MKYHALNSSMIRPIVLASDEVTTGDFGTREKPIAFGFTKYMDIVVFFLPVFSKHLDYSIYLNTSNEKDLSVDYIISHYVVSQYRHDQRSYELDSRLRR